MADRRKRQMAAGSKPLVMSPRNTEQKPRPRTISLVGKRRNSVLATVVLQARVIPQPHPNESWDVAFAAENPGIWMFHCHMLLHAPYAFNYDGITTPLAELENSPLCNRSIAEVRGAVARAVPDGFFGVDLVKPGALVLTESDRIEDVELHLRSEVRRLGDEIANV